MNQDKFNSGVISMDNEDVKALYYHVMRMAGKLVFFKDFQLFQRSLDNNLVTRDTPRWLEANSRYDYVW